MVGDQLVPVLRAEHRLLRDLPDLVLALSEHALALDPRSVEAQSLLALTLTGRVLAGMTNTRAADISRAKGLIGQALAVSPRSTAAHLAKGQLLRTEGRCDEAIPEFGGRTFLSWGV